MRSHLAVVIAGMIACSTVISDETGIWAQETQAPDKQAAAPAASSGSVTVKPVAACGFCLEDGTKVPLTLGRELSSAKESTGNRVDFLVSEDVKINDVVVIPKGSSAYGTIVEAQAKRRLGRAGKLNVRIEEVRLTDGSRAKLRATQENKGKGRQGAMTAGIIGTGILFFPVAPLFLFMHGKDIVIAKDTPVVAYVDGNTELDPTKFGAAPKPPEVKPPEEGPAKEKPENPALVDSDFASESRRKHTGLRSMLAAPMGETHERDGADTTTVIGLWSKQQALYGRILGRCVNAR